MGLSTQLSKRLDDLMTGGAVLSEEEVDRIMREAARQRQETESRRASSPGTSSSTSTGGGGKSSGGGAGRSFAAPVERTRNAEAESTWPVSASGMGGGKSSGGGAGRSFAVSAGKMQSDEAERTWTPPTSGMGGGKSSGGGASRSFSVPAQKVSGGQPASEAKRTVGQNGQKARAYLEKTLGVGKTNPLTSLFDVYFHKNYWGGRHGLPLGSLPRGEEDRLFPDYTGRHIYYSGENDSRTDAPEMLANTAAMGDNGNRAMQPSGPNNSSDEYLRLLDELGQKETLGFIDNFKDGDYLGGTLEAAATALQQPQSWYLNGMNALYSAAYGKPYRYIPNLDYAESEKLIAARSGADKSTVEMARDLHPMLGMGVELVGNTLTDPLSYAAGGAVDDFVRGARNLQSGGIARSAHDLAEKASRLSRESADTVADLSRAGETAEDAAARADDVARRADELAEVGESMGDYNSLVEKAQNVDVSASAHQAVFYSGAGNRTRAEAFAKLNGKMTLEMTHGGKYFDSLRLFEEGSPVTKDQAYEIWKILSERYAKGVSGNVYGFVKGANPGSIFNTIEYPALQQNPHITNIFTELFN